MKYTVKQCQEILALHRSNPEKWNNYKYTPASRALDPDLAALAKKIGHSTDSVALKIVQFHDLDWQLLCSGSASVGNTTVMDRTVWFADVVKQASFLHSAVPNYHQTA